MTNGQLTKGILATTSAANEAKAAAKAAPFERRNARNKEARDAKTLDELKAIGTARGHDSAWAPYYWREVLKRPMPKPAFPR